MKKLIFIFFAIMLLPTCKKRIGVGRVGGNTCTCCGLPAATQTGANIFACDINDSNWVVPSASVPNQSLNYWVNHELIFGGELATVNGHYYIIWLYIYNGAPAEKTYYFSDSLHTQVGIQTDFDPCGAGYTAITVFPKNGSMTLTKVDTVNNVLSGTFSFDMPILILSLIINFTNSF